MLFSSFPSVCGHPGVEVEIIFTEESSWTYLLPVCSKKKKIIQLGFIFLDDWNRSECNFILWPTNSKIRFIFELSNLCWKRFSYHLLSFLVAKFTGFFSLFIWWLKALLPMFEKLKVFLHSLHLTLVLLSGTPTT